MIRHAVDAATGGSTSDEKLGGEAVGGNLPGLGYAQHIVTVWGDVLTSMAEGYNRGWNQIKRGEYGVRDWMKTWANAYEASSDMAFEVLKGPIYRSRPEWLHIRYDRATNTPNVLAGTCALDRKCPRDVILLPTPFQPLGPTPLDPKQPSKNARRQTRTVGDLLWKKYGWTDDLRRNELRVELDKDLVRQLAVGHYMGFMLAAEATAEPPLIIVMLQVV